MKQKIYKDIMTGDVIYQNNKGTEFVLMETVSPLGKGSYDILTAFKLREDGYFEDSPIWWYGSGEVERFFSGKDNDLVDMCKTNLDEPVVEDPNPIDQYYRTLEEALDAACAVMYLNGLEDYTIEDQITWDHVKTMQKIRDILRQAEADITPLMESIPNEINS